MATRKLTYGALLMAIGITLPQVFHILGGQGAGSAFLPMHLPIFFAGLLLGPHYGLLIGVLTPLLSHIFTGMPPMAPIPILLFMICELMAYGYFTGRFAQKRLNIYVNLMLSTLIGRAVSAITVYMVVTVFSLAKIRPVVYITTALITGIPGTVLQLVAIPILYFALEKGGFVRAGIKESS